jgi:hypothetical protein
MSLRCIKNAVIGSVIFWFGAWLFWYVCIPFVAALEAYK